MADFAELDALLTRRNQRFICVDLGWPTPGPERFIAKISHAVSAPLNSDMLAALKTQVPSVPELLDFYSKYGSARLYCDTVYYEPWKRYSSAFYIAHPDEWAELKDSFEGWVETLSDDEKEELLPPWFEDYVVIGEVPNSGNYFLVPLTGPETGYVYEFEHDGFEFIPRSNSIAGFISTICTVSDELIREIRGHTRYFDGKTDIQWLADQYEFDKLFF